MNPFESCTYPVAADLTCKLILSAACGGMPSEPRISERSEKMSIKLADPMLIFSCSL